MITYIKESDIIKNISMSEMIEVVEKSLIEISNNNGIFPQRTIIQTPNNNLALFMPSFLNMGSISGIKIGTITPNNVKENKPLINGIIVLINSLNGEIKAILDAAHITALKTGAVSAVATKYLSQKQSENLFIIGTGAQAKTQVKAVCAIRNINKIFVFSRNEQNRTKFTNWLKNERWCTAKIMNCESIHNAIEFADIICIATSTKSEIPILKNYLFKKFVHINSIGGCSEKACEFSYKLINKNNIYVEKIDFAVKESGEIASAINNNLINKNDLKEIGSVIGKNQFDPRSNLTVFKSVGLSALDISVGEYIYNKIISLNQKGDNFI